VRTKIFVTNEEAAAKDCEHTSQTLASEPDPAQPPTQLTNNGSHEDYDHDPEIE